MKNISNYVSESIRERILEASFRLFSQRGYKGTTTRAIAEEAQVNELTIFRNFGTKSGLFISMIDEQIDISVSMINKMPEPSGDLIGDLTIIGLTLLSEMRPRLTVLKLVLTESGNFPDIWANVSNAPTQFICSLNDYFQKCKDRNFVGSVDTKMAALTFFSFFFSSAISHAFFGTDKFIELDEVVIRGFVEFYITGLRSEMEGAVQ